MRTKLPPMPPNLGLANYDWFVDINDITDAIKRWEKGERPTEPTRQSEIWEAMQKHDKVS